MNFYKEAQKKYKEGAREHGKFDPKTTTTTKGVDLLAEMKEECLDLSNYAKMLYEHLCYLQKKFKRK